MRSYSAIRRAQAGEKVVDKREFVWDLPIEYWNSLPDEIPLDHLIRVATLGLYKYPIIGGDHNAPNDYQY